MTLQFFNSLTRRKETFKPLEPGHARLYTCGPTVYNHAHIGNFRAYLFEDVLRRTLLFAGYRVTQVMNLTDVDDKTIHAANAAGLSLQAYTRPFIDAFFNDLKRLSIQPAEHYPAATDHIPDMIALIQKLLDKGLAYCSDDGSVYFSVARFPAYGRLARLDLSGLKAGARVAQDEYEKEGIGDFALWKAWDRDDGPVFWDAPWGRGRPGWHIECSAMGMAFLGEQFDLHTGGIDNMFPHHVNEIAQSEGATGKSFVQYWLHCAHLRVNGEKMSKSLGNIYRLEDLLKRGFTGREIRFVLLGGHYRQPLNFTFDALAAARVSLRRLDAFLERLADCGGRAPGNSTLPAWAEPCLAAFQAAMANDLATPEALAVLFDLVHTGNRELDCGAFAPANARALLQSLEAVDRVTAILPAREQTEGPDAAIQELLKQRETARANREWATADRLRDLLAEKGWVVQDTPQGQKLKPVKP